MGLAWAAIGSAHAQAGGAAPPSAASAPPAAVSAAALFKGADLGVGERLLQSHRCAECHAQRTGGDGSAIYRPLGRVNTPAALVRMVERCDTELGLQLFPDDVQAVAAVLNQRHYRFR
jgi:hypothetical protein